MLNLNCSFWEKEKVPEVGGSDGHKSQEMPQSRSGRVFLKVCANSKYEKCKRTILTITIIITNIKGMQGIL